MNVSSHFRQAKKNRSATFNISFPPGYNRATLNPFDEPALLPSLFSLSRHKWPSAVALLAMLMLFIAPVISTSLAHHRAQSGETSGQHHKMAHSEGMMEMGPMDSPVSPHPMPGMGASLMDDIACGYCQLLLHIPLIVWIFIPFIWLAWRISSPPPPAVIAPILVQHDDAEALPRAPPAAALR
jgi:hypothetical protein